MSVVGNIFSFAKALEAKTGEESPLIAIEVSENMWMRILGQLPRETQNTILVSDDCFVLFGIEIRKCKHSFLEES